MSAGKKVIRLDGHPEIVVGGLACVEIASFLAMSAGIFLLFCMMFPKGGCVYIMTNKMHTVFYTGVSSDITGRVWQHKNKFYPNSYTARYNCDKLVYYAFYPRIEEAIAVENALKGGNRKNKIKLVNSMNPEWRDLYDDLIR
ncbi:GIY-YIG nuclease family protein [uncultured Mucilaginibacter sp.]|uniref:GIY-YIG nuclease family protein n=1 Tax=uncultured Mucilaginibacter sp. TaxID=797541 RepID=UPI0025CB8089|nr:GIY-YIG nuclease family protein [uncultured Mucilaginibacter sp.]